MHQGVAETCTVSTKVNKQGEEAQLDKVKGTQEML